MSEVCRMVMCVACPVFTAWLPARAAASAPPWRHDARAGLSPRPIPVEPTCFRKSRRLHMDAIVLLHPDASTSQSRSRYRAEERCAHAYTHRRGVTERAVAPKPRACDRVVPGGIAP